MDTNPLDKRMEKGEQTRARILNAAIAVIAEKGIKEVSAAKLASATGVSKSNIFHHFKSVDEILIGVLHIIFNELLESMTRAYPDTEQFLNALGDAIFHVPEEDRRLFKAFFSFYYEGMFNAEFQKALDSYLNQITQLIQNRLARLASRSVAEETVQAAASLVLSSLDGMGLHFLLNGNAAHYERAWRLQVRMIARLLSEP
ncbi:TetR/AcrR family transcriptional regulator [Paenibacillus sp. MBLB4367]|uniref:TetR/AcrR family transcriptional regulator n=1 Tax=Paenibacillus sp. MBLB4367 TaxID=3384767 RepID=UPI0039083324